MAMFSVSAFSSCFGCFQKPPPPPVVVGAPAPVANAAAKARDNAQLELREQADALRDAAVTLMDRTRALAVQVDALVGLEVEHGFVPAPSAPLQQDLLRVLPTAMPVAGTTGASTLTPPDASVIRAAPAGPPPLASRTPQAVAQAMTRHPSFADHYAWMFLMHARMTFVPAPAKARLRLPFTTVAPVIDLRDHVHHAALALERLLSPAGRKALETTLMHFDHEVLRVRYNNTHTLVLEEPIADIPREDFLATADGYAWDMQELVQAIGVTNQGVFKNPVSLTWFAQSDIKAILAHPAGAPLRQMQEAHARLRNGVRRASATALAKLGAAWKTDQAQDGRSAVRAAMAMAEYQAFVATLPEAEQQDLAALPTTGIDTHTGRVYNASTVLQVLGDHDTCFHKRGDMLEQTAYRLLQRMDEN